MAIKASSTITLIRVDDGDDGDNGIIIQASAPANPYVGQLWQTASGAPVKRWDGSKWAIWYLDVSNLNVENLSAISSTLGTVVNPYDTTYEGEHLKGKITISDSLVKNEYNVVGTGQKGDWQLTPLSYSMHLDDGHGNLVAGISLEIGQLGLYTNKYNRWLYLTDDDLYRLNNIAPIWANINWGWQTNQSVTLIRYGYMVALQGYWHLDSAALINNTTFGEKIPQGYRPTKQTVFLRLVSKQHALVANIKIRQSEGYNGEIICENALNIPAGEDFWLNATWITAEPFPD